MGPYVEGALVTALTILLVGWLSDRRRRSSARPSHLPRAVVSRAQRHFCPPLHVPPKESQTGLDMSAQCAWLSLAMKSHAPSTTA